MEQMATIGLDIAKSVFQVHGIEKNGSVVVQRRLRRSQVLGFGRLRMTIGLRSLKSIIFLRKFATAALHFGTWARPVGNCLAVSALIGWPAYPRRANSTPLTAPENWFSEPRALPRSYAGLSAATLPLGTVFSRPGAWKPLS